MRTVHLAVGALTVVVFLGTGQLLRHHTPPMASLSDATRLLYRSRHIYILASGLVNLMLGLYMQRQAAGWRATVRAVGSGLVLASAPLLMAAFALEPRLGFQPEMNWSSSGLYALFGGSVLHAASGVGRPGTQPRQRAAGA